MDNSTLTYLATGSDGGGVPDMISHMLWLWGKDPEQVHSLMILDNLVLELALGGVRSFQISDETVNLARYRHPNSVTVTNIPREVKDTIITRFISARADKVHLVDAVRTLLGVPVYNHTCHSLIAFALGLNYHCPPMPEDVCLEVIRKAMAGGFGEEAVLAIVGARWSRIYEGEMEWLRKNNPVQTAEAATT